MIPFAFFHILTILKTFFVDKKGQLLQAADLEIVKSISSRLMFQLKYLICQAKTGFIFSG
jgi:hypothetical protein